MKTTPSSSIELLESRIAPATIGSLNIVSNTTATYTDVDGDVVTVKISAGDLHNATFTGVAVTPGHDQLQTLDLTGANVDHASVTFTVKKVAGGDGLVNVGYINAAGHDLGSVNLPGDLGQIDAGDATVLDSPGIKSLTVNSLGRLNTDTQDSGNANFGLESDIVGGLGSLTVAHDVQGAFLNVTGGATDAAGTIGPVKIGGSLIGDSRDHSGELFSTGDMGAVTIGEDIRGGSGTTSGWIQSNGSLGNVTVAGSLYGGYLTSNVGGGGIEALNNLGAVKIGHDVIFGTGSHSGYISGGDGMGAPETFASLTIGGSLIGNSTAGGTVESGGSLGPVKIGANILGGLVNSGGKIAAVTIGGSIVGGSITSSGVVSAGGAIGMVKIGGDLQASTISFTGLVFSGGDIAGVTVGGSVIGANGNSAVSVYDEGGIVADGNLGPVSIAHDLIGGKNTNTHDSIYTGVVEAGLRITSVTIGGNIVSGTNSNTGTLENSGAIIAGDDLGSLTVKGSLIGNAGVGHGATPVEIVARGQHTQGANTDVAIGKITVAHRVEHAQILAGYDTSLTPVNADAQIGAVTVGGDWIASDLIAGAYNKGADHMQGGSDDNINFGNADDTIIAGGSAGIMSKIASVTIQGALLGTPVSTNNTDNFGFVAQQIGSIKVGGGAIAIPTNNTPLAVGETSDVDIHIIP